jgi:rhamnogalacturonan endolyase
MAFTRRRALQIGASSALSLLLPPLSLFPSSQANAEEPGETPVSLEISGMDSTISNAFFTVKFNSSGTGYSLVWRGQEWIGPAKGFYSSVNGSLDFAPTQLVVTTNTPHMVDIAYISDWGELHYVVFSNLSGMYSYFVATGIGTVGEYRTLYRFNGNLINIGYNGVERAIAFPSLAEIEASTVLQDSTYLLPDGTVYTKYDASTYCYLQDRLHGVYNSEFGAWMISPSHEYVNGGPMKQELTVHMDASSGDAVLLNMLAASHFGTPSVTIPSGKIYGPWLVYFNNGSIDDALRQAAREESRWPYRWLSNPHYPLERSVVTGRLRLADGRPAAGAMIILAQPGGDVYAQGSDYIFFAQADFSGSFFIPHVRPETYSLYAFANGGLIGDVTDQFEQDGITVSGPWVDLGQLTWSPPQYKHFLWQIGHADRKADEFRLGNVPRQYGLWNQVPANLIYTIGQSTPENDWYYAQTQAGTWTINFNLERTYSGTAHLTIALAGMSRTAAVTVAVNGTAVGTYPAFTNDMAIYRSANQSGYYHLIPFTFPATLLQTGANSVTLQATEVSSGGGAMYDTIKLEVD